MAWGWCKARDGVNHRLAWAMDSYRPWAGVDHGLMWAVALAHLRAQPCQWDDDLWRTLLSWDRKVRRTRSHLGLSLLSRQVQDTLAITFP